MPTGVVKFFNSEKGYGFIKPDGGGADIFVHISALSRSEVDHLREGDKVSYEPVMDARKGKENAQNIKLIR